MPDLSFLNNFATRKGHDVFEGCLLSNPRPSRMSALSSDCVAKKVFQFCDFHSTPGLQQNLLCGVSMRSQERDPAVLLSGRLADHSRFLSFWNITSPSFNCHHCREIRPTRFSISEC